MKTHQLKTITTAAVAAFSLLIAANCKADDKLSKQLTEVDSIVIKVRQQQVELYKKVSGGFYIKVLKELEQQNKAILENISDASEESVLKASLRTILEVRNSVMQRLIVAGERNDLERMIGQQIKIQDTFIEKIQDQSVMRQLQSKSEDIKKEYNDIKESIRVAETQLRDSVVSLIKQRYDTIRDTYKKSCDQALKMVDSQRENAIRQYGNFK